MSNTRYRLEKIAVIGPLVDVGNLGIPSGVGYAMGNSHKFLDEEEAQDYLDDGPSIGGALLVPGYTGYRMGKSKRARQQVRRARRRSEKRANVLRGTRDLLRSNPQIKANILNTMRSGDITQKRNALDFVKFNKRVKLASDTALDMAESGGLGPQAEAVVSGVNEALQDAGYFAKQASDPWNSYASPLYDRPEEARQHRLDTLLRR